MKKLLFFATLVLSLTMLSCQKTKSYKAKLQIRYENNAPQDILLKDYAKALFSLDTSNFAEELKNIQDEFIPFLRGNLDNDDAVRFIKDFATDTFCLSINKIKERNFNNGESLEKDIRSVYQHLNYYYPDIEIPNTTYTYISGIDYNTPAIMIQPDAVLIGLDYYLGNDERIYDYVGMPRFRSLRCQPYYITRDLAQSIYNTYLEGRHIQKDVLTDMIAAGKRLYFIEAMNPSLPDSVILAYSSKQMEWANRFEGDIWASIVGDNMLYSNEVEVFRTLFVDGPFTAAFSNESPARLGEYIGLQIIRSYMSNNDVSLQELLKETDIQNIFQNSYYKPKS